MKAITRAGEHGAGALSRVRIHSFWRSDRRTTGNIADSRRVASAASSVSSNAKVSICDALFVFRLTLFLLLPLSCGTHLVPLQVLMDGVKFPCLAACEDQVNLVTETSSAFPNSETFHRRDASDRWASATTDRQSNSADKRGQGRLYCTSTSLGQAFAANLPLRWRGLGIHGVRYLIQGGVLPYRPQAHEDVHVEEARRPPRPLPADLRPPRRHRRRRRHLLQGILEPRGRPPRS